MTYFTKKEILENLKSAIEKSSDKDSLAHIVVGCYNKFNVDNPYIADNSVAVDALSNFAKQNHTTLYALMSYVKENAYYYGGEWNTQRVASELEIALIEDTANETFGKSKDKKIALKKINDSLTKVSDTELAK